MTLQLHFRPRLALARSRTHPVWAALPLVLLCAAALWGQEGPATVGRLEGGDIAVTGPASVSVENNRSVTVLISGSEVTVRSGQARIQLVGGGELDICGPAHFTVLKSSDAITLALDSGRIHVVLGNAGRLSVYTPMIVATPVAIGGAPRVMFLGVDPAAPICIHAVSGAVRLDEQLTAQSVVVPQGAEMSLPNGQLSSILNSSGTCRCDVDVAKVDAPPPPPAAHNSVEYSVAGKPIPAKDAPAATKPPEPEPKPAIPNQRLTPPIPVVRSEREAPASPPAVEVPTWKVVMPPLTFNASAPIPPPEPSPEAILLVREVRDVPELIVHGRVEAPPRIARLKQARATKASSGKSQPPRSGGGFFTKLKRFFGHLGFGHGRCAGAGCGTSTS